MDEVTQLPPLLTQLLGTVESGGVDMCDYHDEDQACKKNRSPLRTCVVTRTIHPKEHLLRFVIDPMGQVMEDLAGRCPGRGIYVTPEPNAIRALLKRMGVWKKMAGTKPVFMPESAVLLERLACGLTRRLREGIGLAKRSGMLRKGLSETMALLDQGHESLVLLLAADTAENTREKFDRMVRIRGNLDVLELSNREFFGAACGVGPVAVLAIIGQNHSRRIKADGLRWLAFFGKS
ncbi:MAG: DUF448 domain-containing protein [Magnetococcus sp. DMHC-6]